MTPWSKQQGREATRQIRQIKRDRARSSFRFGRFLGWTLVFSVSLLSSIGVYLGRFQRWNSWDILNNYKEILRDTWYILRHLDKSAIGFTALFTVFFLFVYLTLYAFGHLLQEQNNA